MYNDIAHDFFGRAAWNISDTKDMDRVTAFSEYLRNLGEPNFLAPNIRRKQLS